MRDPARRQAPITEIDLQNLHRLVVLRSKPDIAGRYADQGRYVSTDKGRRSFPSPAELPALMGDFAAWLGPAPDRPDVAFGAHRRLVEIHPFNDGKGPMARLLMNLVLIRGGYPPVAVRPEDRAAYIAALQVAQAGGGTDAFDRLLYERLDATLAAYVSAARQAIPAPSTSTRGSDGSPRQE